MPGTKFHYAKKFGDENPWRETARAKKQPPQQARPVSTNTLRRLAAPDGSASPFRASMAEVMKDSPYPFPQTQYQKEFYVPPEEFSEAVEKKHKHKADFFNKYIDQRTKWMQKGSGVF